VRKPQGSEGSGTEGTAAPSMS